MEYANIYLCKADCSLLGTISGIKTETCQLTKNLTDFWELTFEVERYTDKNGILVQSSYYDSIDTLMKIYFDSNDVQMFFVINTEPNITGDGYQETKTVTAYSIECELNNIFLKNFKINCGTKDSQEYLATDSNNNAYNINPYTELPYEYISLVNYRDPQLSLMHLALQNTGWTVKSNINPEICQIKKSFEISSNNIYAFLMEIVSPSASVLFEFDRKHKQIGMIKLENCGDDTGIFVTMRNLMNHFEVSGTEDNIITKLTPNGADNLGIEYVNFGKNYIINLDYFMDTLNEYGDYKYVSTELHNKYHTWKDYRDSEQSSLGFHFTSGTVGSTPQTIILKGTRRELYKQLSKLYNQTILDISERKNRVPNDGASIDYKTYSLEELKISLNAYNQALAALITIYKNEYGVTQIGNAPNYTPIPSNAVNIKDTPYWYDFYAYKESIIPKVEQALKMYCQTDENGNLITDNNGNFIELEFGNPDYYADSGIVKEVDSYKYEWSLYGLDELESKKKAWSEAANLLFDDCFIQSGTIANPTAYRTPNEIGWNSLSETQKKRFTSQSAYIEKLNQYLDYMSFNVRDNSLTKTKCKGVIRQCDDAIRKIKNEISLIEQKQDWFSRQRREIANSVTFENFKVNNTLLFTEKELNIIHSMIREDEYTNDNILITNLDDIVTTIDAQEELYQSTIEKLFEISQPQYSFHTELDNIYALDEFQYYQKPFEVGNFIRVGLEIHEEICDNKFIKLRLISITYNPLESNENLSVEFSTIVKAINGISDLGYFLGKNHSSSGGSSSGSSSSSSNGGTYGNNNANVQISNNMLNALLNTELFGTTVTDVILDSLKSNRGNFNTLFSHSGIFDSLEAGRIKVSGTCLFDIIKSSNYVEGKSGSILDLLNGSFDFAGGKLKWDGKNFNIIADSFSLSSGESLNSILEDAKSYAKSAAKEAINEQTQADIFNKLTNNGALKGIYMQDNELYINATYLKTGYFSAERMKGGTLTLGGNNNTNGILKILNASGTEIGHWDKDGIVATNCNISGDVTANTLTANKSGTIAGWTFNENGFYKGNANIANIGMYLGNDGISVDDFFVVKKEGAYIKSKDWVAPTFENYIGDDNSYLLTIDPGEWVKIYIYNTANIDYFEMSWHYDFDYSGMVLGHEQHKYYIAGWGVAGRTEKTDGYYVDGDNVITFVRKFEDLYRKDDLHYKDDDLEYGSDDLQVDRIYIRKFYSMGRTMQNGRYCHSVQIGKIEFYSSDNTLIRTIYGNRTNTPTGMMINTFSKHIYTDVFSISNQELAHTAVYNSTNTSSPNLCINSDGQFMRSTSSSKRYKKHISQKIPKNISPEKLYNLNIYSYKYKNNYLSIDDQRYNHDILGFIAEDVYEKYPEACNLNENGKPEMWNINILFPAALKLIQDQHKELQAQKRKIKALNKKYQAQQKEIEELKTMKS